MSLDTHTLWFQLEDMFQLIVTPQGIEKVTIQLIDTPKDRCEKIVQILVKSV